MFSEFSDLRGSVEKEIWYYKKDDSKEGPFSHEELQHLLDSGEIASTTKVWMSSFKEWLPITEVEHFNMTSLDEAPTVIVGKKVSYPRETDDVVVRPRIWVRFWARMIDYSFFALVIGVVIGIFKLPFIPMQSFIGMLLIFLWVFIEAFLLSTWGKTPGKWLFRISVRDQYHQKLSFSDAMNRSFSVWWLGMAAGIPIVVIVTLIVAAVKLSNAGMTSWDRSQNYQVFHGKVGVIRTLVAILYFLILGWFFSWGNFIVAQGSP